MVNGGLKVILKWFYGMILLTYRIHGIWPAWRYKQNRVYPMNHHERSYGIKWEAWKETNGQELRLFRVPITATTSSPNIFPSKKDNRWLKY
jgi:hypothetical protein